MPVLLYAPAAKVIIATASNGIIDVTDDLTRAQISLIENAPSPVQFSLANHRRKYDRVFTPNDRVVIQLRRIGPFLQSYSGYLNQVPYFSVYPRTVTLTATCTLKRIQYHPWDPGAQESFSMLHQGPNNGDTKTDSGVKEMLTDLLTKVVGWPNDQIHIGEVPKDWFDRIADVYMAVAQANQPPGLSSVSDASSASPTISGVNLGSAGQGAAVLGIGPGTGTIPASSGRCSWFGGPGGGAYGHMALSGEPGGGPIGSPSGPRDQWYCAMRWQYVQWVDNPDAPTKSYLPADEQNAAFNWWKDRRVLVTNPKNGRSVVLRAADWGPYSGLDRAIDMSQYALETVLQGATNDVMNIAFAPDGAPLGPYSILAQADAAATPPTNAVASNVDTTISGSVDTSIPSGVGFATGPDVLAWGGYKNGQIPDSATIEVEPGKRLAPLASDTYLAMRSAAAKAGVTLSVSSGYRSVEEQTVIHSHDPGMSAAPGYSNHGWGMAADLNAGGGPGTQPFDWLAQNAASFGWVNPPWAKNRSGQYEPWHWEFWAGLNDANKKILANPNATASGGTAAGTVNTAPAGQPPTNPMTNVFQWVGGVSVESELLYGDRALMNDEPALNYVSLLANISMRSFMAAPNGDFISWFPDYFGLYGLAGIMDIQEIEVQDFTMVWDDSRLITHQYVAGAPTGGAGDDPNGPVDIVQKYGTTGIVSVQRPEIMRALFHLDPSPGKFGNSDATLARFGARPNFTAMGTIQAGSEAEFWYALFLFQRNWAEQFSTTVPLTFMPELFPGMLMQIKALGFQAYVTQVTHTIDFTDGVGFSTAATIIAPSQIGGGLFMPPGAI